MPGVGIYGATKVFEEYWAMYIAAEYQCNSSLDILCVKPGPVLTNILEDYTDLFCGIVNTEHCVNGVLDRLGNTKNSNGPLVHEIFGIFTRIIPSRLFIKFTR